MDAGGLVGNATVAIQLYVRALGVLGMSLWCTAAVQLVHGACNNNNMPIISIPQKANYFISPNWCSNIK